MSDNWYEPTFNLSEFRSVVAKYVKLLIRARWKHEPGFLSVQDLCRWGLAKIAKENRSPQRLVTEAAMTLAALNTHFIPRCGSGGIPCMEGSSAAERLIDAVAFLVLPGGGGPYHHKELLTLAGRLKRGESIDWTEIVDWDSLPAIRDDLDQLPTETSSLMDVLPKEKVKVRFPPQPNLRWEDVTIEFTSNDAVTVIARQIRQKYMFAELGFADGRKGDLPDTRWVLLRLLAQGEGRLSWNDADSRSINQKNNVQKAIAAIRKRLKSLMSLEEDPFYPYLAKKAYQTRFTLRIRSASQQGGSQESRISDL